MVKVKVVNLDNSPVDEIELISSIFEVEMNKHLVWEAVNAIMTNRRQGTVATKNRKDVRGGGIKPWRQKGTGRARAGSTRSPLWRHGGTVHGPQPREFSTTFPKKKKRKAVKVVLSEMLREEKLKVVENFELQEVKTKALFDKVIKGMEVSTALLVDGENNKNLYLSSRNNPRMKSMVAADLNVYDLLKYDYLLISVDGLKRLEEALA